MKRNPIKIGDKVIHQVTAVKGIALQTYQHPSGIRMTKVRLADNRIAHMVTEQLSHLKEGDISEYQIEIQIDDTKIRFKKFGHFMKFTNSFLKK